MGDEVKTAGTAGRRTRTLAQALPPACSGPRGAPTFPGPGLPSQEAVSEGRHQPPDTLSHRPRPSPLRVSEQHLRALRDQATKGERAPLGGQRVHQDSKLLNEGGGVFLFKQQCSFLGSKCISLLTPSLLASYQISNPIQVWSWLERGGWAGGWGEPSDQQVGRGSPSPSSFTPPHPQSSPPLQLQPQ